MAGAKVTQFDLADTLDGSELVGLVQNGGNVRASTGDIAALAVGNNANIELIRDTMGSTLVAGSGIAIDVDDPLDTVTVRQGPLTVTTQTGATYTLVLADAGTHIRQTNAAGCVVTVPPNVDVSFPIGTRIRLTSAGAGNSSLAAGVGVTLNSRDSASTARGQFSVYEIEKVATDEWDCLGDLV